MRTLTELIRMLLQCRLSVVLDDSVIRISCAVEHWSEVEESIAELSKETSRPKDLALQITGALSEAREMARNWNGHFDDMPEGNVGAHCESCLLKKHCASYTLQ